MPTSFQFNSTQLAEIKRLRDIATRPENKQVPGGGADLYRYIFKAVTGIDVTQSMLSTPIDTVWQANGNAPMPDENRKALTWLYGALQVNTDVGAFSTVIGAHDHGLGVVVLADLAQFARQQQLPLPRLQGQLLAQAHLGHRRRTNRSGEGQGTDFHECREGALLRVK